LSLILKHKNNRGVTMLRVKTTKRSGVLWGIGATLVAAAIFGVIIYKAPAQTTNAAGETITASSAASGQVNQQIAVNGVSIGGTGNDILPVKLSVTSGTVYVTTTTGLTFTTAQGGSTVSFSGTRSAVNAALATLHYSSTVVGSDTLTISLSNQNTIFNPSNGHVYQYIPSSGDWFTARSAATASTYQGLTGYLATITSQDENYFIKDRLSGDAWLGASDDAQFLGEGNWSWVDGPEAGLNFYNGEGSDGVGGGSSVGSEYSNWAGPDTEPNNSGGSENCMETYIASGTWNDLPCDAEVSGYVVEYGNDTTQSNGIPSANIALTTTTRTYATGDGTPQDPYHITDCEQLQNMNQDLAASYVLTHNIDCTDTPNWNGGQGFVPIGTNHDATGPFTGTLDGAGFSIDGLTQIRADDNPDTTDSSNSAADYNSNQDYVGLIGYGSGLTVKDLNLTHAMIKGYKYVGGLVGFMSDGTIINSSVNQALDESADTLCTPGFCVWARYGEYGGGLVGYMTGGTIADSKVGGLVKGSGNIIGGLIGYAEGATISDSQSTAAIDGGSYIGGAVGQLTGSSTLTNVLASGNVTAKIDDEVGKVGYYAGGLVGDMAYASIYASHATGNVIAEDSYAGGLVGHIYGSLINTSYASGSAIASNSYVGGLIGGADGVTVAQSYSTGAVHSNGYAAGGIAGLLNSSMIEDSYSTSVVSATNDPAGGFVGQSAFNTMNRVYASGYATSADGTGGLIGTSFQDTVNDSFATTGITALAGSGAIAGNQGIGPLSEVYFDATSTGQGPTGCDAGGALAGCTAVNVNGSQPGYFKDYRNAPFKQSGTQVWDIDNVWYFQGSQLPVLRMGALGQNSNLPSVDDNDGVSTVVENAAPNNGDGNNDSVQDSTQANVVSFVNPVTAKYVTLEVNSACSVTAITSATESTSHADESYSYPFGLVNYTVDCGTPGFSTAVTLYYHDVNDASGLIVRKFNATTNTYATISAATITGVSPVKVSYTITDGSSLDEDGTANGIIVDPVGLAVAQTAAVVGTPNTGLKSVNLFVIIASAVVGIIFVTLALFMIRRTLK